MAERYDDLWTKGGPDILADVPARPPKGQKRVVPTDFIFEQMDEACIGLPAVGKIWLRILQLKRMRPKEKYLLLGSTWTRRHGISRQVKSTSLNTLERAGLIHVERSDHRNPRIVLIPPSRRRQRNRTTSSTK
jgi:hypothetical protein